jgi:hypothetical protein
MTADPQEIFKRAEYEEALVEFEPTSGDDVGFGRFLF